jgi:hypothetical protein
MIPMGRGVSCLDRVSHDITGQQLAHGVAVSVSHSYYSTSIDRLLAENEFFERPPDGSL